MAYLHDVNRYQTLAHQPFARSLRTVTYSTTLSDLLLSAAIGISRRVGAHFEARKRRRDRKLTYELVSSLPRELREDIGWPHRYEEQDAE